MRQLKGKIIVIGAFFGIFVVISPIIAQQPPASQTVGGVIQQEREIEKEKKLKTKIKKEKPSKSETVSQDVGVSDIGPKTLVSTITVEGAVLLSKEEVRTVVTPFEGKELSFPNIQKIADLITDEYRKKGYVTSRAYIPPQTIREGTLIIRV